MIAYTPLKAAEKVSEMPRTIQNGALLLAITCFGFQVPMLGAGQSGRDPSGIAGIEGMVPTASLDVYVQEPNGAPVESLAVVTLTTLAGRVYQQKTTRGGYVRFNE